MDCCVALKLLISQKIQLIPCQHCQHCSHNQQILNVEKLNYKEVNGWMDGWMDGWID